MADRPLRIGIAAHDRAPLVRADTATLFGRHLARHVQASWYLRGGRASTGGGAAAGRSFAAAILRRRFDIVQSRDRIVASAWHAALAGLVRRPYAYWMSYPMVEGYRALAQHRPWSARGIARRLVAALGEVLLRRWTLRRAATVFTQSAPMAAELARHGVPADRLVAVPMGVDTGTFHPAAGGGRAIPGRGARSSCILVRSTASGGSIFPLPGWPPLWCDARKPCW